MKKIIPKISLFLISLSFIPSTFIMSQPGPYTVGKCGSPPPACALVEVFSPILSCTGGGTIKLYAVSVYPAIGYTFQWWYVSTGPFPIWIEIEGATSTTLTISTSTTYKCYVTPLTGSPYYTREIDVEIASSTPSVTIEPNDEDICLGEQASFRINASGDFLRFQWKKMPPGGFFTDIPGATGHTYSYTPPAGDDENQFMCSVYNGCGSDLSIPATLDITIPPDFTSNPVNSTICQEGNTNFSITATGDISSYSWEYSSNNITYTAVPSQAPFSGNATSQLTLTNTPLMYNNYYFRCKLANSCNVTDYSTGAKLTVQTRMTVADAPSGDYYVCEDANASFMVTFHGSSPISIQWQEYINGWSNLAGQTSNTLTFPVSLSMNNRQYRAVLTQANACNTVINTTAGTLMVHAKPKIVIQPQSQEKCRGEDATFSISATGAGIYYQWQISRNSGTNWTGLINGGHYSGATSANLDISNVQDSLDGYLFRCMVAGTCTPSVTSNAASLTVYVPPSITSVDPNQVKCIGQSVSINSYVSGTPPLTYKWRKDGVSVTDWISLSQYNIPAVGSLDAGKYDYLVKNICEAVGVESDDVTLTVNTPPSVNIQPSSVTICEASPMPTVKFTTNVSGGTSLLWQASSDDGASWTDLANDTIYSGVTTNELTVINPVVEMDMDQFRCQVMGSCDPPVTTNAALLTIKTIPEITVQPRQFDTVCSGGSVTFTVTANSNIPMEYRWKQGGQGITDWLSFSTLVIDEVTLGNDDNYQVMVRNECAYNTPVSSDLAYLTVIPPPNFAFEDDELHLCPGNSILLDPGADYASYMWSTGETTRSIEVTEQGNYTLTVGNENGCTRSDKVYVILDPAIPELDLGFDSLRYCLGSEVILDATDQYSKFKWNDGSSERTYNVTETGTYSVTSWNSNSVCRETDSVYVKIAAPYDQEKICVVTIDLVSGKNIIVWEKTPDQGIVNYNIYRESTIGVYEFIGTVNATDLSIFKDVSGIPESQAYRYKIRVVDTCGNESEIGLSKYHNPSFLQYVSSEGGVNLAWSDYRIQDITDIGDYLTSYVIYRGTDSTSLQEYQEVGSINTYTDIDPDALTQKYYYRVAARLKDPCYPTAGKKADSGPYSQSMSNLEDNRFLVGLNKMESAEELKIYPNPFADYTTIVFPNPDHSKYQLTVRDITGKLVLIIKDITENQVVVERNNLKAGYYSVEIVGDRIFRGKVILK